MECKSSRERSVVHMYYHKYISFLSHCSRGWCTCQATASIRTHAHVCRTSMYVWTQDPDGTWMFATASVALVYIPRAYIIRFQTCLSQVYDF